jgi:hypothetical protein
MSLHRDVWEAARPIEPVSLVRYAASLARPSLLNPAALHLSRLGRLDLTSSPALRYLRDSPHPSGRAQPAIVAAITKAGALLGVELTFVHSNGAALAGKHVIGDIRGGAIRLADPGEDDPDFGPRELIIASSWQDAARLASHFGSAGAWGSVTSQNMQAIALPITIRRVAVLADSDTGFAIGAARKWQARTTTVRILHDDRPDPAELWSRAGMPKLLEQEQRI